MNDLLELAVEAHGGLKRWSQLTTVKASLSITGTLWQLKGQPEALKDVGGVGKTAKAQSLPQNAPILTEVFGPMWLARGHDRK